MGPEFRGFVLKTFWVLWLFCKPSVLLLQRTKEAFTSLLAKWLMYPSLEHQELSNCHKISSYLLNFVTLIIYIGVSHTYILHHLCTLAQMLKHSFINPYVLPTTLNQNKPTLAMTAWPLQWERERALFFLFFLQFRVLFLQLPL